MSGICFIDTETTSLRHDRRAWEIGIITRDDDGHEREEQWFVDIDDLDLGNADVMSLKIGRFHDRHPHITAVTPPAARVAREKALLLRLEELTRGAHLAGAVVSFDADVLGQRMRANGICPSWHYHLIDVEALAAGYLAGSYHAIREVGKNPDADGPTWEEAQCAIPPWKSDQLSRAVGVDPDDFDRHTALGDARWARAIYNAVLNGT